MTTETRPARSATRQIALITLVLLTGSTAVPRGQETPQAPGRAIAAARVDTSLAARLARSDNDAPLPVIVTVRPGAKAGLMRALQAQGATVRADFTIIEAFAADVPAGLLRALQIHPDVIALSNDAEVRASGLATAVSGAPQNGPYTLRSTLGLNQAIVVGQTSSQFGSNSSLTWQHTVDPGRSRLLIVRTAQAARNRVTDVSSVTYGNVPLTRVAGVSTGSSATTMWYLVAPAVGTATVRVSFTNADQSIASATSFTGVDQTAPVARYGTATGTTAQAAVDVLSTFGDVVVDTIGTNADAISLTPGAGMTMQSNVSSGAPGSLIALGAASSTPGNGTVTMRWTLGVAQPWAAIAATLSPAPAPELVNSWGTTITGAGVTVAVIDSGVLLDGGGSGRIKSTRDFSSGSNNPKSIQPLDGYGHGTHVAGLMGNDKADALGVAPGVSYLSLRVLNDLGFGYTSNAIRALEFVVSKKTTYGIDIVNLSLGHPIYEPAATDPLVQAVEATVRAGIVVVVSAGNMGFNPLTGEVGYGGIGSPGNAPSAITVGAVKTFDTTSRADDLIADYSSRGPTWYDGFVKPDIVAPGHRLVSTAAVSQTLYMLLSDLRETRAGRPYLKLSGSSMATGVVSGTVALMIEAARASFGVAPTPNAIKAMLQVSAFPMSDDSGMPYHVLAQGAGAANPAGAVTLAQALNSSMPVGSGWLTTGVTESTSVDGQTIAWGTNIVWGSNIVWGNALYSDNIVWSNNIVWGTSVDWGDNIVWGTNIVWSTTSSWRDNIVWGSSWWDNIVWGNGALGLRDGDNIVWGSGNVENIVWGTSGWEDNIVWGNLSDNIVWGTFVWSGAVAGGS